MERIIGERVTFTFGFGSYLDADRFPVYGAEGTIVDKLMPLDDEDQCWYTVEWDDGKVSKVMSVMLLGRDKEFPVCPFHVGGKVKFVGRDNVPSEVGDCYPPVGTVGEVRSIIGPGEVFVQWPEGVTCMDGLWCVDTSNIAPM